MEPSGLIDFLRSLQSPCFPGELCLHATTMSHIGRRVVQRLGWFHAENVIGYLSCSQQCTVHGGIMSDAADLAMNKPTGGGNISLYMAIILIGVMQLIGCDVTGSN